MQREETDIVKAELTLLQCPINSQQQLSTISNCCQRQCCRNTCCCFFCCCCCHCLCRCCCCCLWHTHTTIACSVATAYKGQRRRRRRLSFVCRRLLLVATAATAAAAVLQVPGVLCGLWQLVGKHIKPDVTPNIATELFHVGAVNKCPAKHPHRTSSRANPVLKSPKRNLNLALCSLILLLLLLLPPCVTKSKKLQLFSTDCSVWRKREREVSWSATLLLCIWCIIYCTIY